MTDTPTEYSCDKCGELLNLYCDLERCTCGGKLLPTGRKGDKK